MKLTAAVAVAAATTVVDAQTPFRSSIDLVVVTSTVARADGSFVSGLSAEDFLVREGGVAQSIQFFGDSAVPIDVVLMVDTSASMRGNLPLAQQAALRLIDSLRPHDRVAVIGFDTRTEVRQAFTPDRRLLQQAIAGLQAHGTTSLYTSLYVALKQFAAAASDSVTRRVIVVVTDGEDTASLVGYESVIAAARLSGVAIYPVLVPATLAPTLALPNAANRSEQRMNAEYEMRALARETGAASFFPKASTEFDGIYRRIALELANQYTFGYVSNRPHQPGEYTRISVAVDMPNTIVRTRTGYVSSGG